MLLAAETLNESLDLSPEPCEFLIKVRYGDIFEHCVLLLLLLLLYHGLKAVKRSITEKARDHGASSHERLLDALVVALLGNID